MVIVEQTGLHLITGFMGIFGYIYLFKLSKIESVILVSSKIMYVVDF